MRKPSKEEMRRGKEERKPLTSGEEPGSSKPKPTSAPMAVPLTLTQELEPKGQVEIIVHQPTITSDPRRKDDDQKEKLLPSKDDQGGAVRLTIPDEPITEQPQMLGTKSGGLRKSLSMTSIRTKIREQRERFNRHQCAGIILFLILGTVCNVVSYLASVWAAQLNAEIIQAAVSNEHSMKFQLKRTRPLYVLDLAIASGPSKYLIGLLNFGGRLMSAIGTVLLVQALVAYCKRRRYNTILKSAAEGADDLVSEVHGGITDYAGECCLSCVQKALMLLWIDEDYQWVLIKARRDLVRIDLVIAPWRMTAIRIRLVGEEEDRLFDGFEVDNQIMYLELKKRIKTVTNIPVYFQNVSYRGERLAFVQRPLQSIKFGEELVVEHTALSWWSSYKACVENAMKDGGSARMRNAVEAVQLHTLLTEQEFFNVYTSFDTFRKENHFKAAFWADGNKIRMREAIVSHFRAMHYNRGARDELDFACRFEIRPRDRGGTLAHVQLHGEMEETKHHVKCHHFGSSNNSAIGQAPDIKDFFRYKLLELVNVGPRAHLILPNELTGRRTSMCIVTKWCDNFVPISSQEEADVGAEVLVQLLLLETFLFIDHLHSENCGQWKGTEEAAIVDFTPRAHTKYTNIKKALLNKDTSTYWGEIHRDLLDECDEKSHLDIARESLRKWDLLSKIDLANEAIKPEKDRMQRQEIGYKGFDSPTEALDQYIRVVTENLTKLIDMLNDGE